jgi:hypothetical protein
MGPLRGQCHLKEHRHNKVKDNIGQNKSGLLAGCSYGVNETTCSAYSVAIIRFTNVSYNRLITMHDKWQMLRSHHLGLIKQTEKNLHVGGY